jgi:hypothetical protein
MKKIFLSTIILIAFSLSIILFEISCKKTANADSPSPSYTLPIATASKLGGVMPDGSTISVDATGKISAIPAASTQQNKLIYIQFSDTDDNGNSIWTANYDGTNPQKINITLPSGLAIDDQGLSISPDHKTIFFMLYTTNGNGFDEAVYACNIDGSNVHKVAGSSDTAIAY